MQLAYFKRLPKIVDKLPWKGSNLQQNHISKYPPAKWNVNPRLSFGFSGCGWLLNYHLGVAISIKKNIPDSILRKTRFAGASAGTAISLRTFLFVEFFFLIPL